jgi:hypothetical protein
MFLKKNSTKILKVNLASKEELEQPTNKNYFVVGNKTKKSNSNLLELSMKIPFQKKKKCSVSKIKNETLSPSKLQN